MEHLIDPLAKDVGDAKGEFQRRRMALLLDRGDGLSGETDAPPQFGLGHVLRQEAQQADFVAHRLSGQSVVAGSQSRSVHGVSSRSARATGLHQACPAGAGRVSCAGLGKAEASGQGGMDKRLARDGVHAAPAGYALMAPLAQHTIDQALAR